jgi:hypothetical protein
VPVEHGPGREGVDDPADPRPVRGRGGLERRVQPRPEPKPEKVESKSGSASLRRYTLWNGWKVTARRKRDGTYTLTVNKSGGSPGDQK